MTAFLDWLDASARSRDEHGLTRRLRAFGGEMLDLAGNDYLGLRRHPRVRAAAVAALETWGAGAGASRLVTGTLPIHEELESRLAQFVGAQSALAFSTGYHANLAAITALSDAGSLVISDAHCHASIIDGCRLTRAAVAVSRHNDLDHVAELLATRDSPRALVIVESIYSVLGDAAPLEELVALTAEADAVLVVDEAHALGVVGDTGAGALAQIGVAGLDHVVITATLSKSLASQGGVVLCHPLVRDHLVNTARPFIYDTGLAPPAAGAALGALEVLADETHLPKQVRDSSARLAAACGVPAPPAAVMSVPVNGPHAAIESVERAAAQGIRIGAFRPPSTPDGSSRLRITGHAQHTEQQLDRACVILAGITRR